MHFSPIIPTAFYSREKGRLFYKDSTEKRNTVVICHHKVKVVALHFLLLPIDGDIRQQEENEYVLLLLLSF